MAGLQNLLEDYRNWTGLQDWKYKKQLEQMFGGDPELQEDFEKLSSGFGPSNIGSGLSGLAGAIKTYHGSPRAEPFTRFNRDFIRKGVYGEGHYVAENPLESKKYTELKGPMFEGNDPNPQHSIYEVSLEWPGAREATDPLSREHFYQFSLPMNRQPGNIRQIMEEIAAENPETANEYIEFLNRSGSKGWTLSELMKQRPEMLIKYGGFDRLMAGKGIPGVAFRDQVTQNKKAADRTYNYAVFDEDIPKITSHNDPGLLKMLWPEYNK